MYSSHAITASKTSQIDADIHTLMLQSNQIDSQESFLDHYSLKISHFVFSLLTLKGTALLVIIWCSLPLVCVHLLTLSFTCRLALLFNQGYSMTQNQPKVPVSQPCI